MMAIKRRCIAAYVYASLRLARKFRNMIYLLFYLHYRSNEIYFKLVDTRLFFSVNDTSTLQMNSFEQRSWS